MMAAQKRKSLPVAKGRSMFDLRLYVSDRSAQSVRAFNNLKGACEANLSGRYRIEVINVRTHPEIARADQIVAIPTLVRRSPKPVWTAIGDLTNTARLVELLNRNKS
jgi:circadian clock protein KaiB